MTSEWQEIRTKAEVAAKVAMRPVAVRRVIHGFSTDHPIEDFYEVQIANGQRFIIPFVDAETIFNPSKFL